MSPTNNVSCPSCKTATLDSLSLPDRVAPLTLKNDFRIIVGSKPEKSRILRLGKRSGILIEKRAFVNVANDSRLLPFSTECHFVRCFVRGVPQELSKVTNAS